MQAPISLDGMTPMAPMAPMAPPAPSSISPPVMETPSNNDAAPIDEGQINRLMEQGYTRGLAMSLNDTKKTFLKRIWVVDNSGSMQATDGHRIVATGRQANQMKIVPCSRWEEIQACVSYHIQIAAAMEAPTTFRLLNHPGAAVGAQQRTIAAEGSGPADIVSETQQTLQWIHKARPGGCTPLTQHILDIQLEVSRQASTLRANGQRVAVVLATDGLPTDQAGYGGHFHQEQFVAALRTLEGLPVWIIIRLCTDEDKVVEFYNELDNQLELSIEVLDDFVGEAQEVYRHNPWLTYGLPLQRMRELGYHERVMDLLDERALTASELRDFCFILFGWDKMDGVADAAIDFDGFYLDMQRLVGLEKDTWNPITKRMEPWINLSKLSYMYGDRMRCFDMCQIM